MNGDSIFYSRYYLYPSVLSLWRNRLFKTKYANLRKVRLPQTLTNELLRKAWKETTNKSAIT